MGAMPWKISGAFATLKKQGRFYRVPIKSLLRVQIKWAIDHHNKKAPTFFMSGSFLFNL